MLKAALPSSLAYRKRDGKRFILDTDASDMCVGAILLQEQNRQEVGSAYICITMKKT